MNRETFRTTATLPLERLNPNLPSEQPMSSVLLQREQYEKFRPALPFPAFPSVSQEMGQGAEAAFGMTVVVEAMGLRSPARASLLPPQDQTVVTQPRQKVGGKADATLQPSGLFHQPSGQMGSSHDLDGHSSCRGFSSQGSADLFGVTQVQAFLAGSTRVT